MASKTVTVVHVNNPKNKRKVPEHTLTYWGEVGFYPQSDSKTASKTDSKKGS